MVAEKRQGFRHHNRTFHEKQHLSYNYIIRDTKSKEILFIGSVYEPNEWKGTTCSNKD